MHVIFPKGDHWLACKFGQIIKKNDRCIYVYIYMFLAESAVLLERACYLIILIHVLYLCFKRHVEFTSWSVIYHIHAFYNANMHVTIVCYNGSYWHYFQKPLICPKPTTSKVLLSEAFHVLIHILWSFWWWWVLYIIHAFACSDWNGEALHMALYSLHVPV